MSCRVRTPRRTTALAVALAAGLSAGATLACAAPASAVAGFTFNKAIAGADRYATAVAAAEKAFPSGADSVVVVNGTATVDGLAAAYVAGLHSAPILYTTAAATPAVTSDEMTHLGVTTVYVVGGTSVVSLQQVAAWRAAGLTVTVYGGANRYDTSAKAATATGGAGVGDTAFVASGDDGHLADALAAGPVSYRKHFPILLTQAGAVPVETAAALAKLALPKSVVVGDTDVVSDTVLVALPGTTTRLGGTNRSVTANLVADWAIARAGFVTTGIALVGAANANAADSLVAAPVAGRAGLPLHFAGTAETNQYLSDHSVDLTGTGEVFGDTTAVSADAITAATSAVKNAGPTSSLTELTDNGVHGALDAGDVIRIKLSGALTAPAVGASIELTDGDATPTVADLVNGTNATFAVNATAVTDSTAFTGAAKGTVLTVLVTAAPTAVTPGTAPGLQTPARITTSSGITSAKGANWDIGHSEPGVTAVNEVQTLTVPTTATGGTFAITGPTSTVSGIAWNASAAVVATNVATAFGITDATKVTATLAAGVYTVTFASSLGNVAAMTTTSALTGGSGAPAVVVATPGAGTSAVAEVQTLTTSGGPTGSFTISNGVISGSPNPIDPSSVTTNLEAEVEAAYGLATGSVTVTGTGPFTVTFPASAGNVPLMYISEVNLSGGHVVAATTTPGVTPTAETQTLTVPTTATGGTFSITGSTTVAGIPFTATQAAMTTAITAAFGGTAPTSVTLNGGVSTVVFTAAQGDVAAMTTTSSLTGPGTAATSVSVTRDGVIPVVSGTLIG